jgi:hypothetical protein
MVAEKSPYFTDQAAKQAIDNVLHKNAIIFQNLGVNSTKKERDAAKVQERNNLREIQSIDPAFIKPLIAETK